MCFSKKIVRGSSSVISLLFSSHDEKKKTCKKGRVQSLRTVPCLKSRRRKKRKQTRIDDHWLSRLRNHFPFIIKPCFLFLHATCSLFSKNESEEGLKVSSRLRYPDDLFIQSLYRHCLTRRTCGRRIDERKGPSLITVLFCRRVEEKKKKASLRKQHYFSPFV